MKRADDVGDAAAAPKTGFFSSKPRAVAAVGVGVVGVAAGATLLSGSGGGGGAGNKGPDGQELSVEEQRQAQLDEEPDWKKMGPLAVIAKPFWKIFDTIRDSFLRGKFFLQDFLSYLPWIIAGLVVLYLVWTYYLGGGMLWGLSRRFAYGSYPMPGGYSYPSNNLYVR
jgi:hypothetical protein